MDVTTAALAASLLYATYLVVKCPCGTPVQCSQMAFYVAALGPVVYVAVCNA